MAAHSSFEGLGSFGPRVLYAQGAEHPLLQHLTEQLRAAFPELSISQPWIPHCTLLKVK